MSQADKVKWNQKYSEKLNPPSIPKANARLNELLPLLNVGSCLDFACGPGGNSILLAQQGFHVTAWDVSDVAIRHLRSLAHKSTLPITAIVVDLDDPIDTAMFDLVIVTFYLNRLLFPFIKKSVAPGGVFFMQTFYQSARDGHPLISNDYKLRPGELKEIFHDWEVLDFLEDELTGLQSILVKKRAGQ
jgi:tellurite methyltransferase